MQSLPLRLSSVDKNARHLLAKHAGSLAILLIAAGLTLLTLAWLGYDLRYLSTAFIGDQKDTLALSWMIYQGIDNLLHRPLMLGYSPMIYGDPNSLAYTATN